MVGRALSVLSAGSPTLSQACAGDGRPSLARKGLAEEGRVGEVPWAASSWSAWSAPASEAEDKAGHRGHQTWRQARSDPSAFSLASWAMYRWREPSAGVVIPLHGGDVFLGRAFQGFTHTSASYPIRLISSSRYVDLYVTSSISIC